MNLKNIAEIKIRLDRGSNLLNWLKNIILMVAGLKYIITLNVQNSMILVIIVIIGTYLIGWLDLNKIRLFQAENELTTSKYNPHLNMLKLFSKSKKFI